MERTAKRRGFRGTFMSPRWSAVSLAAALVAGFASQAHADAIDRRIDALMRKMTLEDKIGQVTLASIAEVFDYDKVTSGAYGNVMNFGTAPEFAKVLAAWRKSRLKIPLLHGTDIIYGNRTLFVPPLGQAASFDLALDRAASEQANLVKEGTRQEDIDAAKAALDRMQAQLDEAKKGPRKEDIDAAKALLDAAKADEARAQTALDETVVKSPRDGVVESLDVHPGDLVKPGAIVRIVDPEDLDLIVYVSAGVLGQMRLGQSVKVTTDSTGDEVFTGTVSRIAEQGEYTPRNLQTQEERVQQVFGVKVDLTSNGGKLKAGMSATAHIDLKAEGGK